jgi:hypothetical protein
MQLLDTRKFLATFAIFLEFSEPTFLETLPHLNWFRSSLRLLFLLFQAQAGCAAANLHKADKGW